MSSPVTDYLAGLDAQLRDVGLEVLPVIEAILPDDAGAIWHGHPVWSLGDKPGKNPVCLLKGHKHHLSFTLWRGQEVSDDSGRLQAGARQMAGVKLRTADDIDRDLFTEWLTQAVSLETES